MGTSESHKLNEKGLRNTLRKFCENRFWDRGWQRTEKKTEGPPPRASKHIGISYYYDYTKS